MAQAVETSTEACRAIVNRLLAKGIKKGSEIDELKLRVAKELGLSRIPSNPEILSVANECERAILEPLLRKKPAKSISGVTVITVIVPPTGCPHGTCAYCPGGPEFNTPKSYTGDEPAVIHGRSVNYDPYMQVKRKVEKLESMGHKIDKVELIIIGGTFNALPLNFQKKFLKGCIDALNGSISSSLEEALEHAERAPRRISGITFETKPDWAKLEHVNTMLEMGVTRVELGVQALDDWIYDLVNRGHKLSDVVEATRTLRDLAFKINYHLMPGLPGSSFEKDVEMFEELFKNPDFRPDMLKIYPTLVLEGTQLYKWWKRGWYKPYDFEELVDLLVEWLRRVPRYVRIQRIQREIPAGNIRAGNKHGNLREIVEEELRKRGYKCECIRCREVGRKSQKGIYPEPDSIKLQTIKYEASGGLEYFISYEDFKNDILIGFVRLRLPFQELRPEIRGAALIRELHVYGNMVPVKNMSKDSWQHKGFGSRLLTEAERVAKEELDRRKLVIISGVGVREYYYRHGYRRDGPYVSKALS